MSKGESTMTERKVVAIKIAFSHAYKEYIVRAYLKGDSGGSVRHPDADYYTNDRSDAEDTARCMLDVPQSTKPMHLFKIYSASDLI
jgi:hypothetical protein